jgi:hypothetical protein
MRVHDAAEAYRCREIRQVLFRLAAAYETLAARGVASDSADDVRIIFGRPGADRCKW